MTYRPTKAKIDLLSLSNNLKLAKQLAPSSKILAVIKANGYGHGIVRVAQHLSSADAFGVASIDEAMLLRQNGFLHRILLLEGLFCQSEIPLVVQNRLDLVIHSEYQLQWLLDSHFDIQLNVWVKVDTGMHRLGFDLQQLQSVISRLENSKNDFCIHLMSHFASADEQGLEFKAFTQLQIDRFEASTAHYNYPRTIANSAGMVHYSNAHYEWVRPGIFLYGAGSYQTGVKPEAVMHLESEIIAIKTVQVGESVGYANSWVAKRKSVIGVVAVGYGDGYPRHAPSGTPVFINDKRYPLVGRVSMDMITIDLTDDSSVQIGEKVELWGKNLPVDEVAQYAGTIGYELLCAVTQRVPMVGVE